jgi:choline dehydrogenase-like flavoprotein
MTLPTEKVDAVIVGSGAAGCAMAAKLASAGKQVVILEAGPDRGKPDLVSSNLWARKLKWNGEPVEEAGTNPVGNVFNSGYGVGGSAMHHYAVWPRLHEADFDMRSRYDQGLDWPIAYSELQAYYDQVQEESGVSGDAEKEIWRPPGAPYPMGPVPTFSQGSVIANGFDKLGMTTSPIPLAVTSTSYNGRPGCLWDGWCDAGCPIGALANPLTIDLPIALANGAVLEANATVSRVLMDASGEYATGVEFSNQDGEKKQLMADMVVLAAFALQNPRIMLASASEKHPDGLGNSSGSLGKYLMTHPAIIVYGLFDEATSSHKGAYGGQLLNQDSYDDKNKHASEGAFGSYQWMIAPASKPNGLLGVANTRPDLTGQALHTFMQDAKHGFASMIAVIEDLPVAENAVSLSENVDRFGTPLAKVTHSTHALSTGLLQAASTEGKQIFEAAGAREVWTGPPASMHLMGGTIMGNEASSSVCNSFGQTHDIPNLVVAGPGLFPSCGGVNPTFTLHSLVARSSAHLVENWNSIIR